MTTILGIEAYKGREGVVLASDVIGIYTSWGTQGESVYKQQTKFETQKIHVDNKKEFAICMAGIQDKPYLDFLNRTLNNNIDVKEAVKRGFFEELHKLNLNRWDYKIPQPENINGLLLATRFDNKPRLYTCWPLGRIEERNYTAVGSGSEYAIRHINKQERNIPPHLSLEEGVRLAASSLKKAGQDIHTLGLDLVVVTADEIKTFGKKIKDDMAATEAQLIEEIVELLPK